MNAKERALMAINASKQNRSLEKVDLSASKAKELTKDFRRAENGMKEKKKVLEDLIQELEAIEKLKRRAKKELDETLDFQQIYLTGKDRYDNVYAEIRKKADELGVDVDQVPSISELNKAFSESADAFRPLVPLLNKVGNALNLFQ